MYHRYICKWMRTNKLKFNDDKTEVVPIWHKTINGKAYGK